mmetsp:Transcript_34085/g.105295  ORF Transcript_34085/g.105295 Transcript_34085/m.105295 type:complete len:744 (-) Transcript_34085:48-2279(-)
MVGAHHGRRARLGVAAPEDDVRGAVDVVLDALLDVGDDVLGHAEARLARVALDNDCVLRHGEALLGEHLARRLLRAAREDEDDRVRVALCDGVRHPAAEEARRTGDEVPTRGRVGGGVTGVPRGVLGARHDEVHLAVEHVGRERLGDELAHVGDLVQLADRHVDARLGLERLAEAQDRQGRDAEVAEAHRLRQAVDVDADVVEDDALDLGVARVLRGREGVAGLRGARLGRGRRAVGLAARARAADGGRVADEAVRHPLRERAERADVGQLLRVEAAVDVGDELARLLVHLDRREALADEAEAALNDALHLLERQEAALDADEHGAPPVEQELLRRRARLAQHLADVAGAVPRHVRGEGALLGVRRRLVVPVADGGREDDDLVLLRLVDLDAHAGEGDHLGTVGADVAVAHLEALGDRVEVQQFDVRVREEGQERLAQRLGHRLAVLPHALEALGGAEGVALDVSGLHQVVREEQLGVARGEEELVDVVLLDRREEGVGVDERLLADDDAAPAEVERAEALPQQEDVHRDGPNAAVAARVSRVRVELVARLVHVLDGLVRAVDALRPAGGAAREGDVLDVGVDGALRRPRGADLARRDDLLDGARVDVDDDAEHVLARHRRRVRRRDEGRDGAHAVDDGRAVIEVRQHVRAEEALGGEARDDGGGRLVEGVVQVPAADLGSGLRVLVHVRVAGEVLGHRRLDFRRPVGDRHVELGPREAAAREAVDQAGRHGLQASKGAEFTE